jgi:signal transduction histidine kinase
MAAVFHITAPCRNTGYYNMRTKVLRRAQFASFWVVLVPVGLTIAALWFENQYQGEVALVTHTYETRAATRDVLLLLLDAETDQRGYLLTGTESYLSPFENAVSQATDRLEYLRKLTTDNPVQRRNTERLKALVDEKVAELRRTMDLRNTRGEEAALEIVQSGRSTVSMDQVRAAAGDMVNEENLLLAERNRAESRTNLETEIIFVSAILITLALLFWAGHLVKDFAVSRDRAERALHERVDEINFLNRELEKRVVQRTAELQESNETLTRANEDLERFAFVASHDLQEPLRMITTYAQLLVKTYPNQSDNDAVMFVSNIVDGTKRMRDLIADLLSYTEISGQAEESIKVVDLNVVIEKVRQNLRASIDDSGAMITSDHLPTLSVYEGHFIPLFQNLIGNAIKYRSEHPPRIHVSVRIGTNELRFAVADNGIGIDPEYHEKIFAVFKRLHGKKIPGTGIGLAICERVVNRYGGRIWVESQTGQGATFNFTLPKSISFYEAKSA